jgi:hypothetical protein
MGNPITDEVKIGTIGELLVQLRLLLYGVQAAPPLKDSGNDLIAIKGECVKFIQVKTTKGDSFSSLNELKDKVFHILALVKIESSEDNISLDKSKIYLIPKDKVKNTFNINGTNNNYLLSKELVESLWPESKNL